MAMDTVHDCLKLFGGMLETLQYNAKRMRESASRGFTNATDLADYMVRKGIAFRDAHRLVGELVLTCIERGIGLEELPIADYQAACDKIDSDVFEAIDLDTCVRERRTAGAPGPDAMEEVISMYEDYLQTIR